MIHDSQSTIHNLQYMIQNTWSTIHNPQSTIYNPQSIIHNPSLLKLVSQSETKEVFLQSRPKYSRDASASQNFVLATLSGWSSEEEWMFEHSASICAKLHTVCFTWGLDPLKSELVSLRPWVWPQLQRASDNNAQHNLPMEMSPLIFMLPRVRSPISQHDASYGNAGARFSCSARSQLTHSICRSRHCWAPPKTSHQGWGWDNAGENTETVDCERWIVLDNDSLLQICETARGRLDFDDGSLLYSASAEEGCVAGIFSSEATLLRSICPEVELPSSSVLHTWQNRRSTGCYLVLHCYIGCTVSHAVFHQIVFNHEMFRHIVFEHVVSGGVLMFARRSSMLLLHHHSASCPK